MDSMFSAVITHRFQSNLIGVSADNEKLSALIFEYFDAMKNNPDERIDSDAVLEFDNGANNPYLTIFYFRDQNGICRNFAIINKVPVI